MHLGDLAFELQLQVLQQCKRGDLASLSRAHTSLRDVADYALYSHIHCISFHAFRSVIETLATSMQKASLVKVLDVFIFHRTVDSQSLEIMAGALPNMLNLSELRISVEEETRRSGALVYSGGINKAIRGGYFRLQTLCLDESLCSLEDIEGIVASQTDLRLLGFYRRMKIYKQLPTIAQRLHQDPSRLHPIPTIFMLDCYEDNHRYILDLLPSYHQPGEALEAFRDIGTSLNRSNPYILQLDLFGISEENIHLFREAMEAVAPCQPKFDHLNIVVHQTSIQNLWQFPEFVKPLTLFQHMETLTFRFRYVLGVPGMHALSNDMRSCLVNSDLERLFPKLRTIRFWCIGKRGEQKLLHHRPEWLPLRD